MPGIVLLLGPVVDKSEAGKRGPRKCGEWTMSPEGEAIEKYKETTQRLENYLWIRYNEDKYYE